MKRLSDYMKPAIKRQPFTDWRKEKKLNYSY